MPARPRRHPTPPGPARWQAILASASATLVVAMLATSPAYPGEPDDQDAPRTRDAEHTADRVELDRPMAIVVSLDDDQQMRGQMTSYDNLGFKVQDRHGQTHHVEWTALPPQRVYAIHRELLPRNDGPGWLALGIRLRRMDDAERYSDRALRLAERADDAVAEQARAIRERGLAALEPGDGERAAPPQPAPDQPPTQRRPGPTDADDEDAADAELASVAKGPAAAGEVQRQHWGELDDAEQQRAVERLDAFAQAGLEQIDVAMQRYETDYFLIYTDMRPTEARRWAQLADRMYQRLAELFDVEPGRNIWRGKALVFLFNHRADYHRFEVEVHGLPGEDTAGRCWTFGSGEVHITLFRQPDRYRFAYVLVHEATHGFVHRYRSPARIPSWLNEGLADTIAAELVPEDGSVERRQRIALRQLRRERDFAGLFDAHHIEAWHYGIASSITAYMIRQNRAGYVAMIDAIKDGTPWRESLESQYGQSLESLVDEWGRSENIRNLSP